MSIEKNKSRIRSERKKDHVEHFYNSNFASNNQWDDIYLMHNALPEVNFNDIQTKVDFLGKEIEFPLMINAITGGFDDALEINRALAFIAKTFSIPMAVGSQSIAVKDKNYEASFRVVRETIGDGIVLSNLNGFATVDEAKRAISMIESDGLQIHLNPAQEICMKEGDRDFVGVLRNIETMVNNLDVPIIVKEVGFGISREVAKQLYDVGVAYVDVAGSGGTNFVQIEDERNNDIDYSEFYQWGIPTPLSLIECASLEQRKGLTASGGINSADQIVKALVLGADMVGISGPVLRNYLDGREAQAMAYIEDLIYKSKVMMLLLGVREVKNLRGCPYRTKGELSSILG